MEPARFTLGEGGGGVGGCRGGGVGVGKKREKSEKRREKREELGLRSGHLGEMLRCL